MDKRTTTPVPSPSVFMHPRSKRPHYLTILSVLVVVALFITLGVRSAYQDDPIRKAPVDQNRIDDTQTRQASPPSVQ